MEVGNDVELIGDYFRDRYAESEPHNKAIGWKGLKIGQIIPGRAAPYKVVDHQGPIGWAPPSSLRKIIIQTVEKRVEEEFISVNFVSMGSQNIINYSVVCKESWPFSEIEKKLYEDFPEFNNSQTVFMFNAKMIERNKTLRENKIKKNSVISVFNEDV